MKRINIFIIAMLAILLGTGFTASSQEKSQQKKETSVSKTMDQQKEVYSCPMHPEVTSDKPGKCPKCGMNLEKQTTTPSQEQVVSDTTSQCRQMCEQMMKNSSPKGMDSKMMKSCCDMGMKKK